MDNFENDKRQCGFRNSEFSFYMNQIRQSKNIIQYYINIYILYIY